MKILELTNFSAGICGVFARVKQESLLLAKEGHEVRIFSSNFVKGTFEIAPQREKIGKILIERFKAQKLGGESYMDWDWKELEREIKNYRPNVIIAHSYRHTHTHKALTIGKSIGAKVFLVTHAPFIANQNTRSFIAKWYVRFFDLTIGRREIKKFDKVIAITRWELPFLKRLGVTNSQLEYIPNGIPEEFFKVKKSKEQSKILFLGRIAKIKDLETLLRALPLVSHKNANVEIVGPAESDYLVKLKEYVKTLNIEERVVFSPPIFDLAKKIKKIDSSSIFVLPSKSEAMPQSLIEAMARERIVIASNNQGSKDLITDKQNGYLFPVGDSLSLARIIDNVLQNDNKKIRQEAKKSVEKFRWNRVIEKLNKILVH